MSEERAVRELTEALDAALEIARRRAGGRVPVIGIAGAQGAGKTTLLAAYAAAHPDEPIAAFSIDDVYRTRDERRELAERLHPLFVTRGPPGTHDMDLLASTLEALQSANNGSETPVPSFDKAADERRSRFAWPIFEGRPSLIMVDGWCIGARDQDFRELAEPLNALESIEDGEGVWRGCVNDFLYLYQPVFDRLDAILYLRPPSFDVVFGWRCQQEEGLLGRPLLPVDAERIARFIQHYERITRHMMEGGVRADVTVQLDAQRRVVGVTSDI
jgi:D-glycerate 3-kinase